MNRDCHQGLGTSLARLRLCCLWPYKEAEVQEIVRKRLLCAEFRSLVAMADPLAALQHGFVEGLFHV